MRQLIRDVLRQVDNRSTVPEIVARLAAARGLAASDINDRCRQALLTMFARGLVTFDMADLPAPGQEDALEGSVEGEDEPPSAGPGATIADVKPLDG